MFKYGQLTVIASTLILTPISYTFDFYKPGDEVIHKKPYTMSLANYHFMRFNDLYNKHYDTVNEYNKHFEDFKNNLMVINMYNKENTRTIFKINEFSSLRFEDFLMYYTGFNDDDFADPNEQFDASIAPLTVPDSLYLNLSEYLEPKHQGNCSNSYLFSAIATIEAQVAKNINESVLVSERQGYDCAKGDCETGGLPHYVWDEFLGKSEALASGIGHPYDIIDKKKNCSYEPSQITQSGVTINSRTQFSVKDEEELKLAVLMYGPLSVSIKVPETMMHYRSGIYEPSPNGSNEFVHAVSLIGYGTTNNVDFWFIKNSWGEFWGENGYMRMIRGEGACGIGERYVARVEVEKEPAVSQGKPDYMTQTPPYVELTFMTKSWFTRHPDTPSPGVGYPRRAAGLIIPRTTVSTLEPTTTKNPFTIPSLTTRSYSPIYRNISIGIPNTAWKSKKSVKLDNSDHIWESRSKNKRGKSNTASKSESVKPSKTRT